MLLDEIPKLLISENGFAENWINHFDFTSEDAIENSISVIYSRTNTISNELYDRFNRSMLSGEYLDIDTTTNLLNTILNQLESVTTSIELPENLMSVQNRLSANLLFHFVSPIKHSIREYKVFLNRLSRDLKTKEHSLLFEAASLNQTISMGTSLFELDATKLNQIFLLNIKLAGIDHNLSVKKEILNNLLYTKNELEQRVANSNKITDRVLIDKCNYLVKKILYRLQEDSKNYLYAFDFEDKELNLNDINIVFYKEFDAVTQGHYEIINNHSSQRKKWRDEIYQKQNEEYCFKDFHILIKEYKDDTRNLAQVENLIDEFNRLHPKEKNKNISNLFDKRALNTTCNYMVNNKFSLMLSNSEIDSNYILEKYQKIRLLQLQTQVTNYFPSLKYAQYLSGKIEHYFKNSDVQLENIIPLISIFENALKDSYNGYEWCRDRNFLAFQLPSDECTIKHIENGVEYQFFLASSFVLPLNYEKILRELREYSSKLEKYKILSEVHENLKSEKAIITDLRENIEKNDRRSIEILGIFSAVVLFTSTSVQIFSIEDIHFKDALKFMLCYAYSLTLFVFLIWLITRENIKSVTWIHKCFFIALALVALTSLLFTLNYYPFNR